MEAAERCRKKMDCRDCLFIIKKSVGRGFTFQKIQGTKGRSRIESNAL